MVKIRKSTSSDGPRVMQIWRDAVDATHRFLTPADRRAIEAEVEQFVPTAPLWLAVDAADIGMAFMLLDGSRMEALFVDPAGRGQGVGRALINHAFSMHDTIFTDVNEQNAQAAGFYKHLGFVEMGRSEVDGQGRPYPLVHLRGGKGEDPGS